MTKLEELRATLIALRIGAGHYSETILQRAHQFADAVIEEAVIEEAVR